MRIVVVPASEFGAACADAFADAMRIDRSPFIALPSGGTPQPMYEELRARAERNIVNVEGVYAVAADEYCAPRNLPGSNHQYFRRYWMSILGTRPLYEFDTRALDFNIETARMEDLIHTLKGLSAAFLGIGMNGHLAFNEPGSDRYSLARVVELAPETRAAAAEEWGETVPWLGMTLGLGVLLQAKRLVLMANGEAKAEIVERALSGPVGSDCPASFVQEHIDSLVILDEAAASRLPASLRG